VGLIHIYLHADNIVVFVYPHQKSRRVYAFYDQGVSMLDDVVADESEVVHIVMGGRHGSTLLYVQLAVGCVWHCVC
jgi:hypothetical protein